MRCTSWGNEHNFYSKLTIQFFVVELNAHRLLRILSDDSNLSVCVCEYLPRYTKKTPKNKNKMWRMDLLTLQLKALFDRLTLIRYHIEKRLESKIRDRLWWQAFYRSAIDMSWKNICSYLRYNKSTFHFWRNRCTVDYRLSRSLCLHQNLVIKVWWKNCLGLSSMSHIRCEQQIKTPSLQIATSGVNTSGLQWGWRTNQGAYPTGV